MFVTEQGNAGAAGSESQATGTETQGQQHQGGGERGDDKEALRRMGEQRDAARADLKAANERLAALEQDKADRDAAEQKRRDEEAAASGQWQDLATKREGELKTAKDDLARLKTENDRLREAISAGLDAQLKALPEKARKVLDATFGADQVMERWAWLHKPEVQELITDKTEATRGSGADPKATGAKGRPTAQQIADEMRARRGLPRAGVA